MDPYMLMFVIALGNKLDAIYTAAKNKDVGRIKGESVLLLTLIMVFVVIAAITKVKI